MDNEIVKELEEKEAPKKKTKEQIKKEREINSRLIQMSKRNRENLGIVAIEPNDNVISLDNGYFVKIYSLKGVELTQNRKNVLVNSLLEFTEHRIRLSSFKYDSATSSLVFLSVYFTGGSYAEVIDEIREFDSNIVNLMKNKFRVSFNVCGVGEVFMFAYMNFNGQMKRIEDSTVLKRATNLRKDFFQDIAEIEGGFHIPQNGKYGDCIMALQYPEKLKRNVFDAVKRVSKGYLSCIDFQRISEEDFNSYEDVLNASFNTSIHHDFKNMVNITFVFGFLYDSRETLMHSKSQLRDALAETGMVFAPCTGIQRSVYESISSMGIYDFHCMRTVNSEIISNLIG